MTLASPMPSPFATVAAGAVLPLLADAHHAPSAHQWSQPEIDALTLAWACQRPLLVRGEPGTGKTQLARAAAVHLGWALHSLTVQPRMEPHELVYRFDAVRRLADAQAQKPLAERDYWEPGPLWKAYGWETAVQYGTCQGETKPAGHVVLIDEIDKADSDLPNSLLEVLGGRQLSIAPLNLRFGAGAQGQDAPLVIITTNEEREMPAAFLRRCVVLNLAPAAGMSYAEWLVQRGLAHFGPDSPCRQTDRNSQPQPAMEQGVMKEAAEQLVADRHRAQAADLPPPGPAEFLDLLAALQRLAPGDAAAQRVWLDKLNAFVFLKHASVEGSPELAQSTRLQQVTRA